MVWVVIACLALAVLLPLLFGLLLSPFQQTTRVELFKAPIGQVWSALSELQQQVHWRQDLQSMQMLDDDAGLRWVERSPQGEAVSRKVKETPNKELWLEMQFTGGKKVTRQAVLHSVPGGTRVTFTAIEETRQPLARIIARLRSKVEADLDLFVRQLKAHFNG